MVEGRTVFTASWADFSERQIFKMLSTKTFDTEEEATAWASALSNSTRKTVAHGEVQPELLLFANELDREQFLEQLNEVSKGKCLGAGGTRKTYQNGDGWIIKVALTQEGVWANLAELFTPLDPVLLPKVEAVDAAGRFLRMEHVEHADIETESGYYHDMWDGFRDKHNLNADSLELEDITDSGQVGYTSDGRLVLYDFPGFACPNCSRVMYGMRYGAWCGGCEDGIDGIGLMSKFRTVMRQLTNDSDC